MSKNVWQALSTTLGLVLSLATLDLLIAAAGDGSSSLRQPLAIAATLGVSVILAVAIVVPAAFLTGLWHRRSVLLGVAPLLLLEAALVAWAIRFNIGLTALSGAAAVSLLAVVAVITLWACLATRLRRCRLAFSIGFALLLVAAIPLEHAAFRSSNWKAAKVSSSAHEVPRVVLLSIDTLRRDAIGYGDEGSVTPALDRLAADSVVFDQAFATAPWTLPSIVSILTGVPTAAHGVSAKNGLLTAAIPTLAQRFQAAGYDTGAIGGNPALAGNWRLAQGFDEFEFKGHRYPNTFALDFLDWALPEGLPDRFDTDDLATAASSWLSRHAGTDFFAWIHFFDPHDPYRPPAEFVPPDARGTGIGDRFEVRRSQFADGQFPYSAAEVARIRELYQAEVAYVDSRVGMLLDQLRRDGLYDETLIVVTSDHGEEFGEHNGLEHGHSLFDELLAVPLIVKLPRSFEAEPGRVDEPVSLDRIAATLLEVCRVAVEAESPMAPSVRAELGLTAGPGGAMNMAPLFASSLLHEGRHRLSVRSEGWKLIANERGIPYELYRTAVDPTEQVDRGVDSPDQVDGLRLELEEHMQNSVARRERYYPALSESDGDDEFLDAQLKALGYR